VIVGGSLVVNLSLIFVLRETSQIPQQFIRSGVTIAIAYFVYQGARWARWLTVVLVGLGGLGFITMGAGMLFSERVRAEAVVSPDQLAVGAVLSLGVGVLWGISAVALVALPSVRDFFRQTRDAA
jgi:hypothetical protein